MFCGSFLSVWVAMKYESRTCVVGLLKTTFCFSKSISTEAIKSRSKFVAVNCVNVWALTFASYSFNRRSYHGFEYVCGVFLDNFSKSLFGTLTATFIRQNRKIF